MHTDKTSTTRTWTMGPLRAGKATLLAAGLGALYILVLAVPVHRHVVGVFSDFYRFYAPDADRIAAGEFPQNTYNPPGYPAVLALVSRVTEDHFTAGKWLSLLAGGLSGFLAFVLHRRLFGVGPALLGVVIVLTAPTFTTYAISPMTDVPFVALCLATMLVIATDEPAGRSRTILGGVLSGFAALFRYNGAFFLVPGLLGAVWRLGSLARRAGAAGAYLGGFLLVTATWAWLNYMHHGAAIRSTNYIDVAKALELPGHFRSLTDVLLADPLRFVVSYARNVGYIFGHTLGASLVLFPVGPLAVAGVALSLAYRRRRPVLIVLAGMASFLLFMSLTHWERRYHLFLLACYAGFAGFAITELARGAARLVRSPIAGRLVATALVLLIAYASITRSARAVRTTLERQPVELLPAARFLERATAKDATVMAMRAQIAQLSGREWRELPGVDTLDQLQKALRERPPDYLVYDRWMRRRRAGLAPLATPDASLSWLEPVYRDPTGAIVIYAVRLPRP
jgi:4-amino-4-deoxy-L-arabinose transferase-like glycosyltransferase